MMPKKNRVINLTKTLFDEVQQVKTGFNKNGKLSSQQQQVTKMMDNLYLDKLKGKITESEYDKFYTSFYDEAAEIKSQLDKLGEAQDNYDITVKYILKLISRAHNYLLENVADSQRWCAQQDSNLRPTD